MKRRMSTRHGICGGDVSLWDQPAVDGGGAGSSSEASPFLRRPPCSSGCRGMAITLLFVDLKLHRRSARPLDPSTPSLYHGTGW
jgi:hypothetical protein